MKNKLIALFLSCLVASPAMAFDLKKQMEAKAKQKAEETKREVANAPMEFVNACKTEIENSAYCKNNKTPDTLKTCLVAHKESVSDTCLKALQAK